MSSNETTLDKTTFAPAMLGSTPGVTLTFAALIYAFSIVLIDIAPFFVGIYVDRFSLSLSQAGIALTVDQAGGVLGAIAGFFLMPRIRWRALIVFASLVGTVANVLTAFASGYTELLFIRFCSGFGVVLVTTVSACILARAVSPDRMFGLGLAIAMGLSALAVVLLDWLRIHYGSAASLASGAFWMGLALLLSPFMSAHVGHIVQESSGQESAPSLDSTKTMGITALVALGLFGLSVNVVYGFVERVGLANGLDQSGVASALALGYIFSAGGSLIPTIFGAVGGRTRWIFLTTVVFLASLTGLYLANTVSLYTLAFACYASAWNMGLAYYMSLVSENDPEHHFTRAMYIVNVAMQSIGPAIAAVALVGAPLKIVFVIAPIPAIFAALLVGVISARHQSSDPINREPST